MVNAFAVVCAVEDYFHASWTEWSFVGGEHFETAWPLDSEESFPHFLVGECVAQGFGKHFAGGDGKGCVGCLSDADQCGSERLSPVCAVEKGKLCTLPRCSYAFWGNFGGVCFYFPALVFNDLLALRWQRIRENNDVLRANGLGFVFGNCFDGFTKDGGVFFADGGEDDGVFACQRCGVESSAQSGFEDDDVAVLFGEMKKGGGGEDFKPSGTAFVDSKMLFHKAFQVMEDISK